MGATGSQQPLLKMDMISTYRSAYFFFLLLLFLGMHPWHMEIPRLGGRTGATAASLHHTHGNTDLSSVGGLHHSSRQRQILHPLSRARDWTRNLMGTSQIRFRCATMGTPSKCLLLLPLSSPLLETLPYKRILAVHVQVNSIYSFNKLVNQIPR